VPGSATLAIAAAAARAFTGSRMARRRSTWTLYQDLGRHGAPEPRCGALWPPCGDRTNRPTIAFFGSSLVSAYWNGAATYYRGIIRALHARGHRRDLLRAGRLRPAAAPRHPRPRLGARRGLRRARRPAGCAALEEAPAADIIVKASGVGVFDELLEAAVLEAKAPHALAIFWDVDAPATLDRMAPDPPTRSGRWSRSTIWC
jgi:hypothetical protein